MSAAEIQPAILRPRQLRLLEVGNPLADRIGPGFFKNLPRKPGVYFFYGSDDRLLYIGQSNDLRARVGSYRHVCPERHPRRTLRLVHRIARIEFNLCDTAEAAVRLEAELLLLHRPPFNRAGVWQAPPWWLSLESNVDTLLVRLDRSAPEGSASIGPLPSSFRYVHAALFRCLLRMLHPQTSLADFPLGWLNPSLPPLLRLPLPTGHHDLAERIVAFASRTPSDLLECLTTALTAECSVNATEQSFWLEQLETLARYQARPPRSISLVEPTPVALSPSEPSFFF